MRYPVEVITRSTFNVIADSTVSDHQSVRCDAGVPAFDCFPELPRRMAAVADSVRSGIDAWRSVQQIGDAERLAGAAQLVVQQGLDLRRAVPGLVSPPDDLPELRDELGVALAHRLGQVARAEADDGALTRRAPGCLGLVQALFETRSRCLCGLALGARRLPGGHVVVAPSRA